MLSSLPQLGHGSQSLSSLVKHSIEPLVGAFSLIALAYLSDDTIDYRYSIVALLTAAITFPGEWPAASSASFARHITVSWILRCCLLALLAVATGTLSLFPRKVLLLWIFLTPALVIAACLLLKWISKHIKVLRVRHRKAVVVGANPLSRKLIQAVADDCMSPIEIVGVFDDRGPPRADSETCALMRGGLAAVAAYCKAQAIDCIYITLPMSSHPRIMQLIDELHDTTASVYFLPDIYIYDLIQARLDTINGIPVVAICETPFLGVNGIIKNATDLILASLILILVSPLLLAVALGVKLTSRGPVLFRQRRYGLDGRDIVVYKFRTMSVCEDGPEVLQAHRDDDRVTPLGAFLRRTPLDELPQFINVLQGRMSIVGPRPHAIAHNEMYRKLIKSYMVRHKVKPGITGWAQINGFRGETSSLDKMAKRIEYDLDYLRNWSPYLDLWIVLRTIILVLKDPNAY